MKKIGKIAIIFMLLLPAVAQAGALELRPITQPIALDEDNVDPSYEKIEFKTKEIIIYPHNIVLIIMEATVGSGSKFFTEVKGSVFPGAVRIIEDDSNVKDITVKNSFRIFTPSITNVFSLTELLKDSKGQLVELITSDGFYQGEILWVLNGYIFLSEVHFQKIFGETIEERNASFLCLKMDDVENIILMNEPDLSDMMPPDEPEPAPDNTPKTKIMWEDTGGNSRKVTLLYITSGISWESKYFLDIFTPFADEDEDNSRLEHWASITNNLGYDLTDVNVRLVAGDIKLENPGSYGSSATYAMNEVQVMLNYADGMGRVSPSNPTAPSSFTMQEFVVYTLPYKITISKGVTKLVKLQTGDVEIVTEYVYDATHLQPSRNRYRDWEDESNGKVKKILKIKNNGKTWPAGMVSVYQDYMLTGQDGIQWTPKGREAKITIGVASDIEVKKKVSVTRINPENRNHYDYDYSITITLRNYKDKTVSIKVFDNFVSDALDLTSDPDFEEKPGNQMLWTISLESGEEKDIVYTYETRN